MKFSKAILQIVFLFIILMSIPGCLEPDNERCDSITGKITINEGAESTFSREVEIHSDIPGAGEMYFGEDSWSRDDYEPFSKTKFYTLSEGFGVKTVYGNFYNTKCDKQYQDSIILLDPDARKFSVNFYTLRDDLPNATFNIEVRRDKEEPEVMRFSNNNSDWSEWETYAETKLWRLTEGYDPKNVYAEFRFANGEIILKGTSFWWNQG